MHWRRKCPLKRLAALYAVKNQVRYRLMHWD